MMRIMELSREALMAGRIITKRNIYYKDTELFKSQTVVNQLVDDLACTFQIGRRDLNIVRRTHTAKCAITSNSTDTDPHSTGCCFKRSHRWASAPHHGGRL